MYNGSTRLISHFFFLSFALSVSFNVNAGEISFSFEYPVEVATPTRTGLGEIKSYLPGDKVTVDSSKPYWVQSRGRVPVVLVPVTSSLEEVIKLNLPEVSSWPPRAVEQEVDYKLGIMVDLMTQFQVAVMRRDIKTAETILAQMNNIQNVSSLNFLKASLDFIKGDIEMAKQSVRKGLERHPANTQGIKMLQTLDGVGK